MLVKELSERDFVHEEYGQNPFRLWCWLLTLLLVTVFFVSADNFYHLKLQKSYARNPFLRVTNRELSLFLWQSPNYMRVHVKSKNGYLPAFDYAERIGLNPEYADEYAIAPPELLFLYHTWKRLLADIVIERKVTSEDFRLFLVAVPEWSPRFWKGAPEGYVDMVGKFINGGVLLNEKLPKEVLQAFNGWKNYYFEGEMINNSRYTLKQVEELIDLYPHYGRSYWCNIYGDTYLKVDEQGEEGEEGLFTFAIGGLSPLLSSALFNHHHSLIQDKMAR